VYTCELIKADTL